MVEGRLAMATIELVKPFLIGRLPILRLTVSEIGKKLRLKGREQAKAEAIVNQFGADRWSDWIEREISHRVR
jgi:hypothetical protein